MDNTTNIVAVKQLGFNLLGRFFGNKSLLLTEQGLSLETKRSSTELVLFSEAQKFMYAEGGVLGATLYVFNGKDFDQHKFLSKKDVVAFVEATNRKIAGGIQPRLLNSIDRFNSQVLINYPRGSKVKQIKSIADNLVPFYKDTKTPWDYFTSPSLHREIQAICDQYPLTQEKLGAYHESFNLEQRQSFFDNVESNPLTHEQRLGVLRSNDKNMVLAAAGTGKTSVMVAKALDLIDRGLATPSEILILAYNKSAAEELKQRLADKADNAGIELIENPQISTFHALGRGILRESDIPTYMSVLTEDSLKLDMWVTNWIINYLRQNPKRLLGFISLFPEAVNPFDFSTQAEYENHIRDNEYRTLKGELVKGYQELKIANWLALHKIPYEYEAPYVSKRRIDVGYDYQPDFHIANSDIYIEHFGIDRQGNTRADIDKHAYNKSIQSKRELHKERETTLVETFHYDWTEDALEERLEERLRAVGVIPDNTAIEDTLDELLADLSTGKQVATWSKMLVKSLQAIRFERLSEDDIFNRLKKAKIFQPKQKTRILNDLHEAYVKELAANDSIDFDDMIIRAIGVMDNDQYKPTWKYILVDEFQDISASRMDFINSIIAKGPDPSLTVVGDDWQSIYRFAGGKLELTTRFNELVGPHSLTMLQKTFRYNNSIADTAGKFVMENPEQYKKHIQTHEVVDESQVYLLDDDSSKENGIYSRVREVVNEIRESDPNGSIAVIARYNYLLKESRDFLGKEESQGINFWSFHKSKGLEADYCILIGFFQGKSGFPNGNREDAIPEALLPILDPYPHSEERRLLYVGITRCKKKAYIIANPTSPSEFVSELLKPKYDIKIVSPEFQERHRKTFKCPNCADGYLRLIKGKYGDFYGCSSGKGCKVGKARVCVECGAPSVDRENESRCNNIECDNSIKICNKCGRPMRMRSGKYGKFWGCSGFGVSGDQCKNTMKM